MCVGRPGAPVRQSAERGDCRGPARRGAPVSRGPGGASPAARRPGLGVRAWWATFGRRGEPGSRTGGRRPGRGADRCAESAGGQEVSAARRGGSAGKVCFRRSLQPWLLSYLSFRLRRRRPGSSPGTGPRVPTHSGAGRCEFLIRAPDALGPPILG